MKNKITLWTAMIFALCLIAAPCSSLATIGDLDDGSWVGGNWLEEFTAADGSKYAIWIDEGGTGAAGNETGDYWFYHLALDGSGGYTFVWDYNVLDLEETKTEVSNATTGFYSMEFEHNDQTGAAGAFYKEEEQWTDPLSGSFDNWSLELTDLDMDGTWGDDWSLEIWDWFDAGTGEGENGRELINWFGGIWEYDNNWSNSLSGSTETEQDRYFDTDLDGNWTNNYYSQYDFSFDAERGWEEEKFILRDRLTNWQNYDLNRSENVVSGHMDSSIVHRIDTDGDDDLFDYASDGGAYYSSESSGFDSWDQYSWSNSNLYDPFNHFRQSTSNNSYALSGDFNTSYSLTVDTDGDGLYESGSNADDYYYTENAGFNAASQDSWSNSELWDIPNRYYYRTSNYSNSGSGDLNDEWWYASDTDADGVIENSYKSDDSYQHARTGYWVDTDMSYSESETSVDGNNKQDAYMWSRSADYVRGNGDEHHEVEGANLVGWYFNWNGYDVGDTGEEGPNTYQRDSTKVWGQYSLDTRSWTFDAGDNGTRTDYNEDTDGDTAWDKIDDYEIYNRSWDTYEGSEHYVGYRVDNNDTDYYERFEQMFSGNGDYLDYYRDDAGDEAEMFLAYASGGTAPITGYLTVDNGAEYQWVWFDGGWSMLPYPIGNL